MSKLETNTIDTVSGTSTLQVGSTNTSTITLGVSGDTINVPSGVTIANSGTATGFGGVNTPAFFAYLEDGTQSGIASTTFTKIEFNAELFSYLESLEDYINDERTALIKSIVKAIQYVRKKTNDKNDKYYIDWASSNASIAAAYTSVDVDAYKKG